MQHFSCFLVLTLASLCLTQERVDYSGYQVLRLEVRSEEDAGNLRKLKEDGLYDFWTDIRLGDRVSIMTSPDKIDSLKMWIETKRLNSSTTIEDVAPLIELESVEKRSFGEAELGHNMDWKSYHSLEDIYDWFNYLETTYDFIETESIGESYEGQDMIVVKVCRGGCGNKPAMWIDGGIHAREWVSPATATWMLNELVKNDNPEFTDKLDWYFLPLHNPDGYRVSKTGQDRMWRKTTSHHTGDLCRGTDLNRNWDFHWVANGGYGKSCEGTYSGPKGFSEIETRNVRDFVNAHKDKIKFYQTLHAFGEMILLPWGYTDERAPGYESMLDLAKRGNYALNAVHGKVYKVSSVYQFVNYKVMGSTLDWVLGVARIPYVYGMELRDTGMFGFFLPSNQIIPTAEEVWAWHEVAAREIIDVFSGKI